MASAAIHSLSTLPPLPSPSTSPSQLAASSLWKSSTHGYRVTSDERRPPQHPPGRPLPLRSMTSVPSGYVSRHGKLHKRSDSGSSLLSATSALSVSRHDPLNPSISNPTKPSAGRKIKPYLRNMSLRDDDHDQGRIDLSRPSAEHDHVSGLGISDSTDSSRSVSDVSFTPSSRRRSSHRRATSLSSPLSIHSTTVRPAQSLIHPYTPPSAFSNTTFPRSEDEVEESADILTEDVHRTSIERWHSRRTISSGSAPYASSTQPLHNHSAASLTKLTNISQTNLSERSTSSTGGCQDPKPLRSRRNTAMSFDIPSSRTSIDRAVSFLSRTSEPEDPSARAANIRALRRAFEEKEAAKERKLEKMEMKRRDTAETKRSKKEERQRRKSEAYDEKSRLSVEEKVRRHKSTSKVTQNAELSEKMAGTEYSRHTPVPDLSLPILGGQGGSAEFKVKTDVSKTKVAKGHWVRFRAWSKTRMLSCY